MAAPEQRSRFARSIDRRQFVASGLSALTATSLATTGVAQSGRRASNSERGSALETAINFDTNLDGRFTNRMHVDSSSADGARKSAVHFTSNGVETTDYAVSLVDVRNASLTLGDVTESGSLTYDYYRGSESTSVVPGPVYLLLQTSDGLYTAFRIGRDQREGGWYTRDVSEELSVGRWRARSLGQSEADDLSADTVVNGLLRGEASDQFEDVPGRYGTDARLLGVGVANGQFSKPVAVDVYFNSVQVPDQSYSIPATVYLESTFERSDSGNRLNVVLAPSGGAHGGSVSLDRIDPQSIRLARYSPITPPTLGGGDSGNAIEPVDAKLGDEGNRMRLAFELDGRGGGSAGNTPPMVVSGRLQGDRETTFFAVGGNEVSGR